MRPDVTAGYGATSRFAHYSTGVKTTGQMFKSSDARNRQETLKPLVMLSPRLTFMPPRMAALAVLSLVKLMTRDPPSSKLFMAAPDGSLSTICHPSLVLSSASSIADCACPCCISENRAQKIQILFISLHFACDLLPGTDFRSI